MAKRITIKEIAGQAGVSPGTVDRILHNRGKVSKRSRVAVEKVLSATGYAGDEYFAATAKPCKLAVLTPSSTIGDYWSEVYKGIESALEEFSYPGISLNYFNYNQFDVYSCLSVQNLLLQSRPDAVIIGPTFLEEAQDFCSELEKEAIPYVFVDSHLPETRPLATFSADQNFCGKAMAHILSAITLPGSKIAVFESRRSGARFSSNSLARRDGFLEYFKEIGRGDDIIDTFCTSTIPSENEQTIKDLLHLHSDLGGIAVLNSRGSSIAELLEKEGRSDIKLISFDLTMRNVEFLRNGSIKALLCQHPLRQGYLACSTLVRYIMQGINPELVHNHMPIDIVIKETLDFYKE